MAGIPEELQEWDAICERLARQALWWEPVYRVGPRLHLDRLGLDQPAVVGHDMGGPVALTFLRRYPLRLSHLALISTNTFRKTPVDFPLSLETAPRVGRLLEPIMFGRVSLKALGRIASKTGGIRPARNNREEARTIRTIFARCSDNSPARIGP